ncbi:MAG: hypothetical protein R3F11_25090 [Verrucomicrobiales bacterium]
MKHRRLLPHAAWLIATAAAFALGWKFGLGRGGAFNPAAGAAASDESAVSRLLTPGADPDADAGADPASGRGFGQSGGSRAAAGGGIAEILRERNPLARMSRLGDALANLTSDDIPAALAAFEDGPRGGQHDDEFRAFMYAWGALDGEAAATYILENKEGRKTDFAATNAVAGWATADPDAAIAFVDGLEGQTRQWLRHGVVKGLAESDLDRASAFALQTEVSAARATSVQLILDQLFEKGGAAEFQRWFDGVEDDAGPAIDSVRGFAYSQAINRVTESEPETAQAMVEAAAGRGIEVDGRAIAGVAIHRFEDQQGYRIAWAMALPTGKTATKGWLEIVGRWASEDPNEAAARGSATSTPRPSARRHGGRLCRTGGVEGPGAPPPGRRRSRSRRRASGRSPIRSARGCAPTARRRRRGSPPTARRRRSPKRCGRRTDRPRPPRQDRRTLGHDLPRCAPGGRRLPLMTPLANPVWSQVPSMDYDGFDQRPFLVFWEITRACALACRHCRAEAQPHRHPGELDRAESVADPQLAEPQPADAGPDRGRSADARRRARPCARGDRRRIERQP